MFDPEHLDSWDADAELEVLDLPASGKPVHPIVVSAHGPSEYWPECRRTAQAKETAALITDGHKSLRIVI